MGKPPVKKGREREEQDIEKEKARAGDHAEKDNAQVGAEDRALCFDGTGQVRAIFFSLQFDDGPLGFSFVKRGQGNFIVTETLDWNRAKDVVKEGDMIAAVAGQMVDQRIETKVMGKLLRDMPRPAIVTFSRKDLGEEGEEKIDDDGTDDV
jgi:hypothetical protein